MSTKRVTKRRLTKTEVYSGISSRGVGSLKKVGEQNEVQGDFELICFDLVSSPSTPGASCLLMLKIEINLRKIWKRRFQEHPKLE